ncbi:MAG: hypothetical protein IJY28_04485 [Clostridia bacterium]|nr:hypothetical protein [Clostridia bacterium]
MNTRLKDYIDQHRVCSDLIFRDWETFLEILFECGGCVDEILWFEYVLIAEQKNSLGGGGYRDPRNPDYMWAETMMDDRDLRAKSLSETKDLIQRTIETYRPHTLVPCFFEICV